MLFCNKNSFETVLTYMKKYIPLILLNVLIAYTSLGQNPSTLKGSVIDEKTQEPLPYTNILILHQYHGTVSNESGSFSLDITGMSPSDTISFQYIGYETKKILLSEAQENLMVSLKEELINLSEAFVYGNPPNPKDIIKKVIENKEANYKSRTLKSQVFIRNRDITNIKKLTTDLKKNSISEIDEEMISTALNNVPRHITSYTDFLGHTYTLANEKDSLKIAPEKTISLKDIEIAELEQFGKVFENMFKETEEEEFWKVKSGIFGQKLDIDEEFKNDTIEDSQIGKDSTRTKYYNWNIKYKLRYARIEDSKEWEFLYKTGKYNYTLSGGTRVNGEDVFIIDFTPKSGGEYIGRVYVSSETYALIKAEYEYGEGKTGRDIHLLGIGYTEDAFKASIYFEKIDGSYQLKYFSKQSGMAFSINRSIQLIKKRKRWLVNKTLKELKLKLQTEVGTQESIEVLFLDHQKISETHFADFQQAKFMKIDYIDHFTDDLWKGYSIIEPTKQMREYQKQDMEWNK